MKRLPVEEGCGDVNAAEDRMERARLLSRSMLSERVSEGPIVGVVVGVVVDGGEIVRLQLRTTRLSLP